ncbi:MAG: hypothetical protein ACAI34_11685 [Verrucomicrobium sp.]
MKIPKALPFVGLLFGWLTLNADWRDDSGYTALAAQQGAALPTGAGFVVLHCEPMESVPEEGGQGPYLPQMWGSSSPIPGTGQFDGCFFHAKSGLTGASGHAASVAETFYGQGSVSQGVTHVECYEADDFLGRLLNQTPLPSFQGGAQNHSYVGTTGNSSQDEQLLRRYDQMVVDQGTILCVPLNNGAGTTVPPLPSSTYNSICVGLRNGDHSRGGTLVDGSGRMKPDLVVNQGLTSYATPAVASCSVILRQRLQALAPAYDYPMVIKALLLAGASKENLPQWQRLAAAAPYDAVYGAGELHIGNSYRLLEFGRQGYQTGTDEVQPTGWDKATAQTSIPRWYYFTVPAGNMADTFSAALTWQRTLTLNGSDEYDSALAVLHLALYASNNGVVSGAPISQSTSTIDNVQHLFLRNLPPGQYALRVTAEASAPATDYAIAWQSAIGQGPQSAPAAAADGTSVSLALSKLDPFVTYTVMRSGNLIDWDEVGTFRTADTAASLVHTWMDNSPLPDSGFYRLKWNGVRQ